MTEFKEIHQAIQNCEPITPDKALEILVHQARHSTPNDTGMDQGYTEEAQSVLNNLKSINTELLEALEVVGLAYALMVTDDPEDDGSIIEMVETAISNARGECAHVWDNKTHRTEFTGVYESVCEKCGHREEYEKDYE